MAQRKHTVFGGTPRVDLLPDAQRAEILHEETLPKLLLALVASAAVAGLIWAAGMIPVFFAQQEHNQLQAQSQQLSTEIASYEEAQQLLRAVGSRESDRQALTVDEVFFAELQDQLLAKLPSGVTFSRFNAQLPGVDGDAGSSAEPECVATGALSTITLTTSDAAALDRAAEFIDGVREIEGFLCGNVIDSNVRTDGDASVTDVQVRVSFDETMHSGRYVQEANS